MAVKGEPGSVDLGVGLQTSLPISDSLKDDEKKQTSYTLSERVGLDELLSRDVLLGTLGELIGAAVMVFMIDTIVISTNETDTAMPNLIMAILIGITVAILLLARFPVSGGALNPVITFSAALVGLIPLSRALLFIAGQCVGSVLGALALKAVVSKTISNKFNPGSCAIRVITEGPGGPISNGISTSQAFWLETFCTFSLLLAAVWVGFNPRLMKSLGPVIVFSTIGIVIAILVFVSTTVTTKKGYAGAGMNPARCFGAAVVRGGHLWDGHWIFWAGPAIACFAFYFYAKAIYDEEFRTRGRKYDFLGIIKALITRSPGH